MDNVIIVVDNLFDGLLDIALHCIWIGANVKCSVFAAQEEMQ